MVVVQRVGRVKLRNALERYRRCQVDLAFIGAAHPDDREGIEANAERSAEKLDELLVQLLENQK